jgi:hypothetical protein
MKRASTVVMLAMLMVFVAGTVLVAANFDGEFRDRVARQQNRIDQGIRKGEITQSESQVLQDNLNWVKGEEARLRSEGPITPYDQKRLMKTLDDIGHMIGDKRKNYKRVY